MDLKIIESLLALFESSSATKISIQEGEFKFLAEKKQQEVTMQQPTAAPTQQPTENIATKDDALPQVTAPLVGTVYLSPAPGEPPFVSVDQKIKKGDTLCIIEAMKVMNEIPAPFSGTIRDIVCRDGAVVGFGDELMIVER